MEDYYIPAVTDSEFLGQRRVRFPHALQFAHIVLAWDVRLTSKVSDTYYK